MNATATTRIRFNPLLPYWAVLQTDLRQAVRSWVYRLWVLMCVLAAGGFMIYKVGIQRELGVAQSASVQTAHLLSGTGVGGLGLIALLAVSGISSERSSVADAVLCRGISRHQYFLAKWHARVFVVVSTFVVLAAAILTLHDSLFDPDLTTAGGAVAVGLVALMLTVIVSWGVTIGALASGTVTGITLFWVLLYGGLALLSLLPVSYSTPEHLLGLLKNILRSQYDSSRMVEFAGIALTLSAAAAVVGLIGFSRKDV